MRLDGSYLAILLVEKGYKILGFLKKDDVTTNLTAVMNDIVREQRNPPCTPQDETTSHNPVTPYGVSKLAAHLLAGLYRRRYGMYVASEIL